MTEYKIIKTDDYLQFENLFTAAGLEFNLGESGTGPEGFVTAFACMGEDGALMGAAAVCRRKGCFILNDIAVEQAYRGKQIGKELLFRSLSEMRGLGASEVYITAKAPLFFEKYGFCDLDGEQVPDVFGCLSCSRYGKDCCPKFMKLTMGTESEIER